MDGRTALLVVETLSGKAKGLDAALAALAAGGLTLVRREATRSRLDELILSMRGQVDCVVLAGGDGIMSGGAIALRDTRLPLGILPAGERNDLARVVGVPEDLVEAAGVVVAGQARPFGLGSVNGRPFFTVASVGLSIEGARELRRAALQPMGRMRFTTRAFRALMQTRRFSAIIRCGAVVHRVRTVQVTVGNGRLFTGGMVPGTSRPVEDGTLGVYSLEPNTRWGLMFMPYAFTTGAAEKVPEARVTAARVVEVVTRVPQPIYADGEMVTLTPARFGMLAQGVNIYAPAEGAAGLEGADPNALS